MRKIGEKFAVFLLIFCMLTSSLPGGLAKEVSADGMLSESVNIDGGVYKEIEPGKMELVGYTQEIENGGTIEIPETVTYLDREYTVVSIGDYAFNDYTGKEAMGEVIFPDTLERIGIEAFRSCTGIQSLTLPEGLKRIENMAFWDCTSIGGELVIPMSVSYMGKNAFRNIGITGLTILNPQCRCYFGGAFADCTELIRARLPEGMRALDDGFFLRCTSLTEVNLPEGIPSIPREAFRGCSSLTEIHIPTSVGTIGAMAFAECTGLKEVVVPEGVTQIPSQTFWNCSEELCVILPDSITFIYDKTFWSNSQEQEKYSTTITVKCTSWEVAALAAGIGIKKVFLNEKSCELIQFKTDGYAFTVMDSENKFVQLDKCVKSPDGEVVVPETVEWDGMVYTVRTIGRSAFYGCNTMTKIILPDTITGIGSCAFMSCNGLQSIHLPAGITRIETDTFTGCYELKDIILPGTLEYIGKRAFWKCQNLQTVEVPGSCTHIDTGAFQVCTALTEVMLHEGITEIGSHVFDDCARIQAIRLPDSLERIGDYTFRKCLALEEITLSQGLTELGTGIFSGCRKLTGEMVLPDSVTTIRQGAFAGSSLSSVHVGNGLTLLEDDVFPDTIRVTTNSPEVWVLLASKINSEHALVFLWDGTQDVPAGVHGQVEKDIVVTDSVTIEEGAIVTIAPGVTLTVEGTLTNNGLVEGEGTFTVNGVMAGTGSLGEGMQTAFVLTEDMVAAIDDAVFSAVPIMPEPVVSITSGGKIVFEKGTDYTYSYANNTNPGTADITITPKAGGRLQGEAVTKHFVIKKASQTAPAECNLTFSENEDEKTFTAEIAKVEGAEYSFDGETWWEVNTKTDCQPDTEYTAYIRMKETDTHFASDPVKTKGKTPEKSETPEATPTAAPTAMPTVSPDMKLAAPKISQAKSVAGKKGIYVQITVKPVAGADRYEIYRTVGKKTKRIKTTASGKVKIQDEKPVQSAKYYAVAVSKDGKTKSQVGTAKAIKLSKGTKIRKVSSTSKGIEVTWKKAKNAKKYVLYRSTRKNSGYEKVKTLGKTKCSYTDKKAKKKKKYYYKVAVLTKSQYSLMSTASKGVKR